MYKDYIQYFHKRLTTIAKFCKPYKKMADNQTEESNIQQLEIRQENKTIFLIKNLLKSSMKKNKLNSLQTIVEGEKAGR